MKNGVTGAEGVLASEGQEPVIKKTFKLVRARTIHPSSIIPRREHDDRLSISLKAVGVQQTLIVRPLASNPDESELIDGHGRLDALDPESKVCVEVREATDVEVFEISDATSVRSDRSARERAAFYTRYLEAVKKEKGEKKAASIVARKSGVSESELSQLLTINKIFASLEKQEPGIRFEKVERMGVNKLYTFSSLLDKPELVEAVRLVETQADTITEEGIWSIVQRLGEKYEDRGFSSEVDQSFGGSAAESSNKEILLSFRLREISGKISGKREEMATALRDIRLEKLASTEKTVKTLEKMLTIIHRMTSYCKRLEYVQDDGTEQGTTSEGQKPKPQGL